MKIQLKNLWKYPKLKNLLFNKLLLKKYSLLIDSQWLIKGFIKKLMSLIFWKFKCLDESFENFINWFFLYETVQL